MTSDPEIPNILAQYDGRRPAAPAWFDAAIAQTPTRSHFSSQGAQIELLTWGEAGKPGLLFLPGNGAHADWWSAIAPFFAADYRCASLSWSGMGRSGRRADGYVIGTFAQEAADAISAAGFDPGSPPIVIGHSMGGIAGLYMVAAHPQIGGLIVIDAPLAMPREQFEALRSHIPKSHATHRPFASLSEGLARFRLTPTQSCDNHYMVDHIARFGLVEQDGAWVWHFDPRRPTVADSGADLAIDRIGCPMALIYGDHSGVLKAETLASTLSALPEGAPVVVIPDAAHHVPLDQPLALVAALRVLLARWPAPGRNWQD